MNADNEPAGTPTFVTGIQVRKEEPRRKYGTRVEVKGLEPADGEENE